MADLDVFIQYLREVVAVEVKQQDAILDSDDVEELLDMEDEESEVRQNIFGYPTRPLIRELGTLLYRWMQTMRCPVLDLPVYALLDEQGYGETRACNVAAITPLLEGLNSLWDLWSVDERKFRIRQVLLILQKRGLLDLLGLRKTVGTLEVWPPSRKVLRANFEEKHSPRSELSVGARALAKHCHRDETSSWWGSCTGTEKAKNEHAAGLLKKILDNAAWINIHQIVHDVQLLEVREHKGYGARWTHDGEFFRGFLEPQMADGHESGWRH